MHFHEVHVDDGARIEHKRITMRFADEVAPADDLKIPAPSRKPAKRELEMASELLETLQQALEDAKKGGAATKKAAAR